MPVHYRPARAQDLQRADELVALSINDLTVRHGFGPIASPRPPQFQLFSLQDDPAGLWVAEDAGDMLGFAFSWICGKLWFLAQLFVAPGQQGRGIGKELLRRTLQHADAAGADNKVLITFTFNQVSQGLYIRHGMFPRLPIYFLSGPREGAPSASPRLLVAPIEGTASGLRRIAQIDADVLGVSREKHHRYLLNDSATRGVAFYSGSDCVGYAYISRDGHIGPLAATSAVELGAVFTTALSLAAEMGTPQVSAFIPGASEAALHTAVEHGMRITLPMVLLSARDFGDWSRYLPRNPGFM